MDKSTVLIVDDDHVSLALLKKLVEKSGHRVLMAENGNRAIEILNTEGVDVIVADYEMPEVNGIDLLRMVRNEFPRLPFILITAYSNGKVLREAWREGAFDFFEKPVFIDRLNRTIRLAVEYGHLPLHRRFPTLPNAKPDPDLINVSVLRELSGALEANDLLTIAQEFDIHARVELEQILRFSFAKNHEQVREWAHRLAGTAINFGLEKFYKQLRKIELKPANPIRDAEELEKTLEQSLLWMHHHLSKLVVEKSA